MKKVTFILLLLIVSIGVFAQSKKHYDKIIFENVQFNVQGRTIKTVRITESTCDYLKNSRYSNFNEAFHRIIRLEKALNKNKDEVVNKIPYIIDNDSYYHKVITPKLSHVSFYIENIKDLEILPDSIIYFYAYESNLYKEICESYEFEQDSIKKAKSAQKRKEDSVNYERSRREQSARLMYRSMTWHDYLTAFCTMELNYANGLFGQFLDKYLNLVEDSSIYNDESHITYLYKSIGIPKNISVKYKVISGDAGYYYIDNVLITGDFEKIVNLFIKYWPTEIQLNNLKRGEWVYCYLAPDRVGLYLDSKGNAKIFIEKMEGIQ